MPKIKRLTPWYSFPLTMFLSAPPLLPACHGLTHGAMPCSSFAMMLFVTLSYTLIRFDCAVILISFLVKKWRDLTAWRYLVN